MEIRTHMPPSSARRDPRAWLRVACAAALLTCAGSAVAAGTDAGLRIDNAAQASFQIGGVSQPDVTSNTVSVVVDELLDVNVTNVDAGPVNVASPSTAATLTFDVTNTGNGTEAFRLIADSAPLNDDFDPVAPAIYIESNGTPGLQLGAGGDTVYAAGTNDPVLAHDASARVYVASNIPANLAPAALGNVALRSVANTVVSQAGTDDPANPAFPSPGTTYAGAGDPAVGGGNSNAVVGSSYTSGALLLVATGTYRVNAAPVTLTKAAIAITDPFGGNTVVPGTVIRYQVTATVGGNGAVDNFVVNDPLPAELGFVAGSLTVSAQPPGESADDDFIPAGTDNTGFDGANNTVIVTLGTVASGGAPIVITFDATIR
jgi:fimbrial isopeptide formation D2 family protein